MRATFIPEDVLFLQCMTSWIEVYRMTEKKLSSPIATKTIMITSGRFWKVNIYPPDLQSDLKSS
jgi:hypothetical protein